VSGLEQHGTDAVRHSVDASHLTVYRLERFTSLFDIGGDHFECLPVRFIRHFLKSLLIATK